VFRAPPLFTRFTVALISVAPELYIRISVIVTFFPVSTV
jgi:hypothetical protein